MNIWVGLAAVSGQVQVEVADRRRRAHARNRQDERPIDYELVIDDDGACSHAITRNERRSQITDAAEVDGPGSLIAQQVIAVGI